MDDMDDGLIKSLNELVDECMNTQLPIEVFDKISRPTPAFVSITHKDVKTQTISISNDGSKFVEDDNRGIVADVFLGDSKGLGRGSVGLEDMPDFFTDSRGFKAHVREEMDDVLKSAGEDYLIRKGKSLKSAEHNIFLKLSPEETVQSIESIDKRYSQYISDTKKKKLEGLSRYLSKAVRENNPVQSMSVEINCSDTIRRFANSEGTIIRSHSFVGKSRLHFKIRTDDSRIIEYSEDLFHTRDPSRIKSFSEYIDKKTFDSVIAYTHELARTIPLGTGNAPVIMDGFASETLFHELVAHLVSGKYIYTKESSIFAGKIGKIIMPQQISIFADPTKNNYFGSFDYDEEGVKSQNIPLIQDGVLMNYLLDRVSAGMLGLKSNGHARSEWVTNYSDELEESITGISEPRIGNLFVNAKETMPESKLMDTMIEHCNKYNHDFGLYVKGSGLGEVDVKSGDFKFIPMKMYKVYPNGKMELTSGSYLAGNPSYLISEIAGFGDKYQISCGICGSDSGSVPEGGRAPSTFIKNIAYKDASGDHLTAKLLSK